MGLSVACSTLLVMARRVLFLFVLLATIAVCLRFNAKYTDHSSILYGDALGYYMYLPSTFIYHNLKSIQALPDNKGIPESVLKYAHEMGDGGVQTSKGYVVDQYTYAMALMELPFFSIAHGWEKIHGLAANGFSATYNTMMRVCNVFYALLGLCFTFLVLRRYFNQTISFLITVLILMGTNLFWFIVYQPGMSHTVLFALYALLMLLTIKIHEKPATILFAGIGFLLGLIVIMRPTDAVSLFIPLLYNVKDRKSLKEKIAFLKQHKFKLLLAAVIGALPILPQLAYWKLLSGNFLFYSYGNNQQFDFGNPKIIEGLFYFSNGWLPYALPMIFALVGLSLYKYYQGWILPIIVIFPIYVYLIYSWYCFNYVNGLGSRPMLHLYPLFALPLAAFMQFISLKKWYIKGLFCIACILMIGVNYSFSMLKTKDMLNSEEANMRYCMSVAFKNQINYNDLVCSDIARWQPDSGRLTYLGKVSCLQFEDSVSDHFAKDKYSGQGYYYHMADGEEYMPHRITVKYSKTLFKEAKWLRCSGRFMFESWPDYRRHVLAFSIKHGGDFLTWKGCVIDNKIGLTDNRCEHPPTFSHFEQRRWGSVYYFIEIPENIEEGAEIILEVWSMTKKEIAVDDLCLEMYK